MRTKQNVQHSNVDIAMKVDYCEDMRRLRMRSRIEALLVRLREEIGQSFMNPSRVIICGTQRRGIISCIVMCGISCRANDWSAGAEDVEGVALCVR